MKILIVLLLNLCVLFSYSQETCNFKVPYINYVRPQQRGTTEIVPLLNSNILSNATIYIVFDGQVVNSSYWNGGNTLVCQPSGLTNDEINQVFTRVKEDFSIFFVNVTTDSNRFNSAPHNKRIKVIVTPTSAWYTNVGGVAYLNSFTNPDNVPAFVFSDRLTYYPKYIGEGVSHETGHTFGLTHQSKYNTDCSVFEVYNTGNGPTTSNVSWAPIMGNSYYRSKTTWSNGTTIDCKTFQDEIAVIQQSGGLLNRKPVNQTYTLINNLNVSTLIIPNKIDSIYLVVGVNSIVSINCISGGNTHTRIKINNVVSNNLDSLNSNVTLSLNIGTYLLEVYGGISPYAPDYDNAGGVSINFVVTPSIVLGINSNDISISNSNIHWNVEIPNLHIEIQMSTDGYTFRTIYTTNAASGFLKYAFFGTMYFRNKVTLNNGEIKYSNIVSSKYLNENWMMYTLSGSLIKSGFGKPNFLGLAKGVYVIKYLKRSELINFN